MKVRRGEVVLVDFPYSDHTGSKVRPALVVQADAWNQRLDDTILALITSSRHRSVGAATQLVYVYVDDVDKHFATAKAAGAGVLSEPADQFYGDRTYSAEDPEGHQWSFAQHVRDVAPEDMHP